ncbi:hypothetical protein HMI54_011240, partial [Coelomomyces lativittatus]
MPIARNFSSSKYLRALLVTSLILFSSVVCAQNLYQIISVDIKQQPLEVALKTISKSNHINFSYSSNFIPKDSLVSINAKNNTVKEVLDKLLSEITAIRK